MMHATAARWKKDLLGFSGYGGLSWLSSVVLAKHQMLDESLAYHEIAAPETKYLEVAGEAVAYQEHGSGDKTMIFLHGFGGRLETWKAIQPTFAKNYRTISLDLWGFGASGRPTWITPRDWSTQVLGVMDALGIASASFVTHSLGGRVALLCTERVPERIHSLTFMDADWGHIPHGYLLAWAIAHSPAFPAAMRRMRSNADHIRRLMCLAYGKRFHIDDELVEQYTCPLRIRGTSATFTRLGRCALDSKIAHIPALVSCPTLILWGEDDYIIPVEWGRKLAGKIPHATHVVIPDVGHFPQEEAPDAVISHMQQFFARIS